MKPGLKRKKLKVPSQVHHTPDAGSVPHVSATAPGSVGHYLSLWYTKPSAKAVMCSARVEDLAPKSSKLLSPLPSDPGDRCLARVTKINVNSLFLSKE